MAVAQSRWVFCLFLPFLLLSGGCRSDRQTLQNALDAMAPHGGRLVLEAGRVYNIDSTLSYHGDNLIIDGYGSTILSHIPKIAGRNGNGLPVLVVYGNNITIQGVTFRHAVSPNAATDSFINGGAGNVIVVGGPDAGRAEDRVKKNIVIRDCRIFGAWYSGIRPRYVQDLRIENNYFENCLATTIFGGSLGGEIYIVNNTIQDGRDDGINIMGERDPILTNVNITGNVIYNLHRGTGITMNQVAGVTVANNVINKTYGRGILFNGACLPDLNHNRIVDITITGNKLIDIGINNPVDSTNVGNGIQYTMEGDSLDQDGDPTCERTRGMVFKGRKSGRTTIISGNIIKGASRNGIFLNKGANFLLTNNIIEDVAETGIIAGANLSREQGISNLTITDNSLIDMGRVGIYISGTKVGRISNNLIRNYSRLSPGDESAIWVQQSDWFLIDNNWIYNEAASSETIRTIECCDCLMVTGTTSSMAGS